MSKYSGYTDKQLQEMASANSANWHTAGSKSEKDALHDANVAIKAELDSRNNTTSSYDSASGKWTTSSKSSSSSGGSSSGGSSSSSYSPYGTYAGGGGNIDLQIQQAIANGASWQEVAALNQQRQDKIAGNPALSAYNEDNTYYQALAYIANQQKAENEAQTRQQLEQARQTPAQTYTMADIMDMMSANTPATPAYTPTQWDATKEALAQAALQMTYNDWTNSDQYRALANRYGHQGQLSMQDVLGQVASRTGGLASSWATTAAQQQYNEYMAQLEEAARNAYNTERGNAIQNAQLAYDFSDSDYGRYLDKLAQYNTDRGYAFDVLSEALSQSNYANEWANRLEQQEYERQRYADETAYNRARYEDETAYNREQDSYNRALQQAQTLAAAGDFSGYQNLGYSDAQIDALRRQYAADQLAAAAGYRGTSGGNERETTYKPTLTVTQVEEAIERGNLSPNVLAAYEYYYGAPYGGTTAGQYNETTDYANSVTAGNLSSIDYDQDEGIITWNGKRYSDVGKFRNDVNTAYASGKIDVATVQKLLNAANAYGLIFN